MKQYYKERFEAFRRMSFTLSTLMEVNEILETIRDEEKKLIPSAFEICVLLLDAEAPKYTKPLQCALHDRPVNCLQCKRNRTAVQKAMRRKKGSLISKSEPITRQDGTVVHTGPEAAIPVFVGEDIVAVINVVAAPGSRFSKKDFYLMRDISELAGMNILRGRKQWESTQEKIRISSMLSHLSPFVPKSVRQIVENNPELLDKEKIEKEVTVLFLDLESSTRLFADNSEIEANRLIEDFFSSLIDPIYRSGGEINETAGDGLMIIFQDGSARANALNAVKAALDIKEKSRDYNLHQKKEMPAVTVNMGLNSGTVLLGMSRFKGTTETRMTFTATGAVTNLASRLADLAGGGEILIGPSTEALIRGSWPTVSKGRKEVKNIEEPVQVFALKPGPELEYEQLPTSIETAKPKETRA